MPIKRAQGFTIVELLIVIIVIAVLAAISVVAYTGIQERAKNSQTITAVSQWVKIIDMYKADNGAYPSMASCLGTGYSLGFSGNGTTGDGECRQGGSEIILVRQTFLDAVHEYIGGSPPTPAFVLASTPSDTPWYRGAYYYTAIPRRIDYILAGSSTECPSIGGKPVTRQVYTATNSVACRIVFPVD